MVSSAPEMEKEHSARHRQRERVRRERRAIRRRKRMKRLGLGVLTAFLAAVLALAGTRLARGSGKAAAKSTAELVLPDASASMPEQESPWTAEETQKTATLGDEIGSGYAVVIDAETGEILAQKNARTLISPASMTKILTVLVAAEHVQDLDAPYTVPIEVTDYCYRNDCSAAGFSVGETVTVRDLFYGTVLPSGADAALALADFTAGSQEAFVELMNEKAAELGLSEGAHFTNCIGLYDPAHICTAADMATILRSAQENDLCREVLSAHTYTTSRTTEHPEGITLSSWFLRRIEDKDTGAFDVLCAKTGYVTQSGSCAASYARTSAGRACICVTADASSAWRCIYDHVALYAQISQS